MRAHGLHRCSSIPNRVSVFFVSVSFLHGDSKTPMSFTAVDRASAFVQELEHRHHQIVPFSHDPICQQCEYSK